MKILISYSSLSGNTKYLAEGIYQAFKEFADLKSVDENIDLDEYDVILHGYWVYRAKPDTKSIPFLESISGKKVGLFLTLGAYPDSKHAADSLQNGIHIIQEENEYIGGFISHGRLSDAVKNRRRNMSKDDPHYPDEKRLQRWEDAQDHPNEDDINAAVQIFKKALSL